MTILLLQEILRNLLLHICNSIFSRVSNELHCLMSRQISVFCSSSRRGACSLRCPSLECIYIQCSMQEKTKNLENWKKISKKELQRFKVQKNLNLLAASCFRLFVFELLLLSFEPTPKKSRINRCSYSEALIVC